MQWLRIWVLVVVISSIGVLCASPGCMDNSYHLAQPCDTKEYHYVECYCPCIRQIEARNQCVDCGHFHEADPWIYQDGVIYIESMLHKSIEDEPFAIDILNAFVQRHSKKSKAIAEKN